MKLVFLVCLAAGISALLPFGREETGVSPWLITGGLHAAVLVWAGIVRWYSTVEDKIAGLDRPTWFIGMGVAYVVGLGGGVYIFLIA